MGRFTAPDPLGDTGGDHDVYDYCVDDPVTMNDPSGLIPPPLLLFLGGKALALSLAAAGTYGAAWVADKLKSMRDGEKSTVAVDAVNKVAPIVAGASAASTVKGLLPLGAGLETLGPEAAELAVPVGHYLGAKLHTSRYGAAALAAAPHVKDFVEAITPGGPPAPTGAALAGLIADEAYKEIKKAKEAKEMKEVEEAKKRK